MRFNRAITILLVLFGTVTLVLAKEEKKSKPRDSNRSLITELMHAEASGSGTGSESASTAAAVLLEKVPKFKSKVEEIKWKLNKARKKLKIAKQYVALADKVATLRKKGKGGNKMVKDVIRKAEIALVHAGEHMGLDYVHFKK